MFLLRLKFCFRNSLQDIWSNNQRFFYCWIFTLACLTTVFNDESKHGDPLLWRSKTGLIAPQEAAADTQSIQHLAPQTCSSATRANGLMFPWREDNCNKFDEILTFFLASRCGDTLNTSIAQLRVRAICMTQLAISSLPSADSLEKTSLYGST